MRCLLLPGVFFLLAGIALLLFPRPLGAAICRAGRASAGRSPFARAWAEGIYDERGAPGRVRAVGALLLLQGLALVAIALFRP